MTARFFDVVIATDTRLRGGGNKSIAEEVRAHAQAGYTTAIYPIYGPVYASQPIDWTLRSLIDDGIATLLHPGDPVETRLLLARGPGIFTQTPETSPRIRAERSLFVVNALQMPSSHSKMAYDPRALEAAVGQVFGGNWEWTALSPVLRREIEVAAPELALAPWDWPNVIDPDRWHRARSFDGPQLSIGRHSRDHISKWPEDLAVLNAAYPSDDDRFRILAMGGLSAVSNLLGHRPPWRSYEFDEIPVSSFLAKLDIFTYFHHPDLVEAFGRTVLEAMASGLPCVLPTYLSGTFGEGPIYSEPLEDLEATYTALYDDRRRLADLAETASEVVRDRFSHDVHRRRLADLVGPPRSLPTAVTAPPVPVAGDVPAVEEAPAAEDDALPTVLFFTDNGHGLGHITRLMAVAREALGRFNPVFLTMSEGFPLLDRFGFPAEYVPSYRKLGVQSRDWYHLFAMRASGMIRRTRARVVVVDHVGPPSTIEAVRAASSGVEFIWSRRGLWREGLNAERLTLAALFDAVVEPGDLAAPIDRGLTATDRQSVQSLPPIVIVRPEHMDDRAAARRALGIPEEGRAVLIQLSDSSPTKLAALIGHVRSVISRAVGGEQVHLVAPLHALHRSQLPPVEGVQMVPVYPMARYLRAFDGVVSTAGYNSFHEVMASGLPAVIVARDSESLDDQARRAEYAELCGRAFWARTVHDDDFGRSIEKMLAPGETGIAAAVADELGPMDGAVHFADLIAERAGRRSQESFAMGEVVVDERSTSKVQQQFRSGNSLPVQAKARASGVVVVALDHDAEALEDLATEVATLQNMRLCFKPVFMVRDVLTHGLDRWGFQFETVMTPQRWGQLRTTLRYDDYVRQRIEEVRSQYGCTTVIATHPGVPTPEWLFP